MLAPAEGALGHASKIDRGFLVEKWRKKNSGGGCLGVDIKAFFFGPTTPMGYTTKMTILDHFFEIPASFMVWGVKNGQKWVKNEKK